MKNYKHGFAIPLIIAVIALLMIGGGVYVFEQSKPQQAEQQTAQQPVTDNQTVSNSNTQVTNPTTSQTMNWKTYTNTQYGFQVNYPTDWGVMPNPNNGTAINAAFYFSPKGKYYQANGQISDAKWVVDVFPKNYATSERETKFTSGTSDYYVYNEGLQSDSFGAFLSSFKLTATPVTNTSQSVTITSPKGGETFIPGQKVNITWQENNLSKVYVYLSNTKSEKDSRDVATIASSIDASIGSINWTVPNEDQESWSPNGYYINIVKFDYDGKGLNSWPSKTFTISAASTNPQTYTNSQYGFSVNYQSGVTTKVPYGWSQSFISAVGTPIVTIPVVSGTFDRGQMDIGVSTDPSNVAGCLSVPPNPEMPFQNASNVTIKGITFLHFSRYSPAAGQFRNTDSYHTVRNGACWSIDLSVDGTETNRLSATQVPLANADFAHIQSELNANLQTFRFN